MCVFRGTPFGDMLSPEHRSRSEAVGFSLLEILIALAIISILAILGFKGTATMLQRGQQAACAANLRSIGIAINQYAADHDGILPGPLTMGQGIYYKKDDGSMAGALQPYLDLPAYVSGKALRGKSFACPAWLRNVKDDTGSCYFANQEAFRLNNARVPLFGNVSEGKSPLRLSQISNPTAVVALFEADRWNSTVSFASDPRIPSSPVHGFVRNQLFLDGHIEAAVAEQPAP